VPDTEGERGYVARFLRERGIAASPARGSDPPDFVFEHDGVTVGLEVTLYSEPVPAGAPIAFEQTALRQQVVSRAWERYEERGGPPLYVNVLFLEHLRLTKKRARKLADDLVTLLLTGKQLLIYEPSAFDPNVTGEPLPEIARVQACRVPEGQASWGAGLSSWIRHAGEEGVARVVANKERRLTDYPTTCSAKWLLIVFDMLKSGQSIQTPVEPVAFTTRSAFDRVFCFDWPAQIVVEIPRSPG